MEQLQSPEIRKIRKKTTIGGVLTKTAFVLGTVGIISYSIIKKKLLGNPTSKIRKGLLYATLAGVILYKCQGDKIAKLYDYASMNISEAYNNFYELKTNNNKKINELTKNYADANSRNLELEQKVEFYSEHDSIINCMAIEKNNLEREKDSLEEKLKVLNEIRNQNASIMKKLEKDSANNADLEQKLKEEKKENPAKQTAALQNVIKQKITDEKAINAQPIHLSENKQNKPVNSLKAKNKPAEYSDYYIAGIELEKVTDSCGGYKLVTYVTNLPHENIFWLIADGKMTFNDISRKYYNNKVSPEIIRRYNRMSDLPDDPIKIGHPIAILEKGLINKFKVYKGGFPRSYNLSVDDNSLDKMISEYYAEDSKTVNVLEAIKKYNRIYGQDVDALRNKALDLGIKNYSILIPRFLKYNVSAGVHEFWVKANDKSGEY